MDFENDVFVSYSHIDDLALAEGQPGWISNLHHALQKRLAQLLGKQARIWRDEKLQGNDVFAEDLIDRLPHVAVLVSVVSPGYVRSEWCQRELSEFVKASNTRGGLRIANKLRVFKVVKTPIPRDQQPPDLQATLGYEFFTLDGSGRERELAPLPPSPPDEQRLYWIKFDDLAHDIVELLTLLEGEALGAPLPMASGKGVVYVAEASSDVRNQRDSIRRDLLDRGYTVLPDQPLPLVGPECAAFVRDQLSRCRLSVHVVGERYGVVPDDSTESIVALQHELAIERAAAGGFTRLIWMPPDLRAEDERQRKFIERLEMDSRLQSGADVLKTALEDFKSVLHIRLDSPESPKREQAPPDTDPVRRVYLICDSLDLDEARPLADFLFEKFEVTLPVFEGDDAQVQRDHEENLIACDAALIYYGSANELWLRRKLRELQKVAGYGRSKPFLAKAIYVAPPDRPDKKSLRTHDALVINPNAAFTPSMLDPFVTLLRRAQECS